MTAPKDIKILCVDDDLEFLDYESSIIREWGYEVLTATGVDDAYSVINAHGNVLALVISDYRMQDGDGFDLRKKMLPNHKDLPFLVVSACIDKKMALQGIELRISAFIDKPYSDDLFKSVIEKESAERVLTLSESSELKSCFLSEACDILEELDPVLVSIESDGGTKSSFDLVFRLIHTLKGSSGVLEIPEFTAFLHSYEDLITKLRADLATENTTGISLLMLAFDKVSGCIESIQGGTTSDLGLEEITGKLKSGIQSCTKKSKNKDESHTSSQSETDSSKLAPTTSPQSQHTAETQSEKPKDSVLVPTKMLDEFMIHSGEITVIRNMIKKLVVAIEKKLPNDDDVSLLADLLENMNKINTDMQSQIVDQRKMPVSGFVKRYPRTIRELSRQLDKPAVFHVEGSDLRVDPKVAATLSKCLIHLVRNSMDHGLEAKDDRKKTDKPLEGRIDLIFEGDGDNTIITIKDDGGGIDVERIKNKLIEKGMFTEKQLEKLNKKTILSQIFEAGFSTAATVTDVSGRGVGMDMVKSSIEQLGGKIELDSELGVGTMVKLIVPVPKSVTIINALLVRAGSQIYSIPQDSIHRLQRVTKKDAPRYLKTLEGSEVLEFSGTLLPIISLSTFLKVDCDDFNKTKSSTTAGSNALKEYGIIDEDDTNMVILKSGNTLAALRVDSILDAEDIVVKELIPPIMELGPYKGATFLGDGTVGLILDCDNIIEQSNLKNVSHHIGSDIDADLLRSEDNGEELLIFKIGQLNQAWAVRLSEVFRFEEFPSDDVRSSGLTSVVPYRNSIAPLVNLEKIISIVPTAENATTHDHTRKNTTQEVESKKASEALQKISIDRKNSNNIDLRSKILTLVVTRNDRHFMCQIAKVSDVTRVSTPISHDICDSKFIEGTTILADGSVVTLIDLDAVLATVPFHKDQIDGSTKRYGT